MTEQLETPSDQVATCPFDHFAAELGSPAKYEVFQELREKRVRRSSKWGGFWILSHAADIEAALLDDETFSSQRKGVFLPPHNSPIPIGAIELDPPLHQPFRRMYTRAVGRAQVTTALPQLRALATEAVERYFAHGGGDFVREVAELIPVEAVALAIGLVPESARQVRERTIYMWEHFTDPHGMVPLLDMVRAEIADRRVRPRNDFLTEVATAVTNGEMLGNRPITDDDIFGGLIALISAGHETTMFASSSLALLLARHPELRRRIVADPTIIPKVVEETLRFDGPVQSFVRTAAHDVEIDGNLIREGDWVMILYGSANHDPSVFPDPETFDPDRANLKHYAFGWGLHRCVGQQLAQAELRLLCELLAPYDFELAGEPVYAPPSGGGTTHGMSSLPLSLRPASPTS